MNNYKNIEYKFYRRRRRRDDKYIGSLTERRRNPQRITCVSIMCYAKHFAVRELYEDRVYFVPVEL
jgi:hypothetical protein